MPHSRTRSRRASRRASRRRAQSGAKSRNVSRKSRRTRSRSRSGSRRASRRTSKLVYVPRGISQGRAKRLVFDGVYTKTRGGLTKSDLTENKYGKVVSIRKAKAGKKLQRENPFKQNKKFMKYAGEVNNL